MNFQPPFTSCKTFASTIYCPQGNVIAPRSTCIETSKSLFELGRKIQQSSVGSIYEGYLLLKSVDNQLIRQGSVPHFAIKVFPKSISMSMPNCPDSPVVEFAAMYLLQKVAPHPNIVEMVEMCENNKFSFLITEFGSKGELYRLLEERLEKGFGAFSESEAKTIFNQILSATLHLKNAPLNPSNPNGERLGLVHRDHSLQNIVLSQSGVCKLIDFGLCSRHIENVSPLPLTTSPSVSEEPSNSFLSTSAYRIGKPDYIAPELYSIRSPEKTIQDPFKCEVWSLGMLLFILVSGFPMVSCPDSTVDKRYQMIEEGKLIDLIDLWERKGHFPSLSPMFRDFIGKAIVVDPEKRITLEEMREHEFLSLS